MDRAWLRLQVAELMARRRRVSDEARRGDPRMQAELAVVKEAQSRLVVERKRHLALLEAEPSLVEPDRAEMIATRWWCRQSIQTNASGTTWKSKQSPCGSLVPTRKQPAPRSGTCRGPHSRDAKALATGPAFDLRSLRPAGALGPAEDRAIEVKGRAGTGAVEVSANEWAKACNLRERYRLYVVYDCATPRPRLVKVCDPFCRLLATAKGSVVIAESEILSVSNG